MKAPKVFDFTDYRKFLLASIEFHRGHNEFSYSKFAERAGFQSRSYLRTVITGKRNLSDEAISKIIVGFGMEFREGECFKALVHFNQAKNFDERHYYWENFLKLRSKKSTSRIVADAYAYLARMAYPILGVVLRQDHIKKSADELSRLTGLAVGEVKEGIQTLKELGVVVETKSGEFGANPTPLTTTTDVPNIAIQTFHVKMLEKAKSAISLKPQEREFQTQMLALSESEFEYLRQRTRTLMDEVEEKFGGLRPQSEKVYALNINLIPVTPEFIRLSASQNSSDDLVIKGKTI